MDVVSSGYDNINKVLQGLETWAGKQSANSLDSDAAKLSKPYWKHVIRHSGKTRIEQTSQSFPHKSG